MLRHRKVSTVDSYGSDSEETRRPGPGAVAATRVGESKLSMMCEGVG